MLAWHESLTDLAWPEILHRHFRPSQNRKWITAKWLTQGTLHSLLSFAWTLTRPTNFNLLRQNIVFSYSDRIPVSFFLIISLFFVFFLLFYVLINFYKNVFVIIILLYFFFMKIIFIFSCSGMFRNVPECSGIQIRNVHGLQSQTKVVGKVLYNLTVVHFNPFNR